MFFKSPKARRFIRVLGNKRWARIALIVLIAVLIALLCSFISRKAAKSSVSICENSVKAEIGSEIGRITSSLLSERQSDFTKTVYSDDGKVSYLSLNAVSLTDFISELTRNLNNSLSSVTVKTKIPIGSVLSPKTFPGKGFRISARCVCSASFSPEVRSEVVSAGVNQSLHSVYIDLYVSVSMIAFSKTTTFDMKETLLISESLIVGNTPSGYVN